MGHGTDREGEKGRKAIEHPAILMILYLSEAVQPGVE